MRGGEEDAASPWSGAPLYASSFKDDHVAAAQFDNTVNAVSFGFVATAILISMFLAMAIFEKFLRATDTRRRSRPLDPEAQTHIPGLKLAYPSPKGCVNNAPEVSVVMPGEKVPTFLANPVPVSGLMDDTQIMQTKQ